MADYICPLCKTIYSPAEAQATNFRCLKGDGAILVVRPEAADTVPLKKVEPQPPMGGPNVESSPPTTAELLISAFKKRTGSERPDRAAQEKMALPLSPSAMAPTGQMAEALRQPDEAADSSETVNKVGNENDGISGHAPSANLQVRSGESSLVAVAILPPPQNFKDAAAMEQLASTLAQLPGPVSLELAGEAGQRRLIVRGAPAVVDQVCAQLYAVYGQIEVEPLRPQSDPAQVMSGGQGGALVGARLGLAAPAFLPLKTWREFEGNDPLAALLGAFDGLAQSEHALSQVVIRGAAPPGWADDHLQQLVHLKRRGFGGDGPMPAGTILGRLIPYVLWLLILILSLWAFARWDRWWIAGPVVLGLAAASAFLPHRRRGWASAMEDEAALKLREPAFIVEVRLFALAETAGRARAILDRLASAYRLFNTTSGNQFVAEDISSPQPNSLSVTARSPAFDPFVKFVLFVAKGFDVLLNPAESTLLNVKELAGLWHMPVGETLALVKRQGWERLLPLPETVQDRQGAWIGISRKGTTHVDVFLSGEALQRNVFIIGKTQHGKTTLMEHLAARWMRDTDRAVVIIDPHGDLARRAIGLAPPERAKDVIYVDLADRARSVSLNLLDVEGGAGPDEVAEAFINVGKALWSDYWGPRMLIPLDFGLRALAMANLRRPPDRQYTILALGDLLNAKRRVRQAFLNLEVPVEESPDIHKYFWTEYDDNSPSHREQVISPVLSKAHAFERTAAIRHLVGQPRSTLHLAAAIRQRKIIVLNANAGLLGDDLAGFLGSLFLNVIREVITRQTELPRQERVRASVVVDEFQLMAGVSFGALLGELQKNGGNFVLGTQSLDNLRAVEADGTLPGKVFAGVTTTIALQANGADARYLVETELDFKRLSPESLTNLPPFHAYVKTIDSAGRRLPAFSLAIADPLTPDEEVVALVQSGRRAYTVPAAEAEAQARASIQQFEREYELVASAEFQDGAEREERTGGGLKGRDSVPDSTPVPVGAQPDLPHPAQRARAIEGAGLSEGQQVTTPSRPRAVPPIGATADPDRALDEALASLKASSA